MKKLLKSLALLIVILLIAVVGGYLALKRADIPYAELETDYATPASRFIDLPSGEHVHYRDEGNSQGRTVLLVHGFGVSLENWAQWVKLLGADYRIVRIDLPGHGLTRVPDGYPPSIPAFADTIDGFADAIGLGKFVLAGNSMGGNAAWMYALKYPTRLDALILVDAAGWPTPQMQAGSTEGQPLMFRLIGNPHIAPLLAQLDPTPLMRNGLKLAYANDALATDEMVRQYSDFARAPGHRPFLGAIGRRLASVDFATDAKLAAIRVPTLILWGDQDELIPVGDAQKFAKAIQSAVVKIYPHIGHLPHEEAAAQSAADVKQFLNDHPANSAQ